MIIISARSPYHNDLWCSHAHLKCHEVVAQILLYHSSAPPGLVVKIYLAIGYAGNISWTKGAIGTFVLER